MSPRGDGSGQQQFGERTGRQESMRASVASTLLQVCSYLIGDRILDVTLCSSVLASGEPHRQAGHLVSRARPSGKRRNFSRITSGARDYGSP